MPETLPIWLFPFTGARLCLPVNVPKNVPKKSSLFLYICYRSRKFLVFCWCPRVAIDLLNSSFCWWILSWVRKWRVGNCHSEKMSGEKLSQWENVRVRYCHGWENDRWEIVAGEKLPGEMMSGEKLSSEIDGRWDVVGWENVVSPSWNYLLFIKLQGKRKKDKLVCLFLACLPIF